MRLRPYPYHCRTKSEMRISPVRLPLSFAAALLFASAVSSLSASRGSFDRRECLRGFGRAVAAAPFALPSPSNAIAQDDAQGISAVTDSSLGRAIRKTVVRGAQVADRLDERWERFSDALRDESRCDANTGRRLYDNGKRKDGSSIGNPGLGALCAPEPLRPLDVGMQADVLAAAVKSAAAASGAEEEALRKEIQTTRDLVRSSFERSMATSSTEEEKNRGLYNFELYYTVRAISNVLKGDRSATKAFQLAWGNELLSMYAPSANRKDYASPFPQKEEEFEDFDYDKDLLFDALGALTVTLARFKSGGLLGYYEISIPYDDYGSVLTVALDDYASIGAEILLAEQNGNAFGDGPVQALVRAAFERVGIGYNANTFFIDPSTTRQDDYNPTQLLLSLNSLSKK